MDPIDAENILFAYQCTCGARLYEIHPEENKSDPLLIFRRVYLCCNTGCAEVYGYCRFPGCIFRLHDTSFKKNNWMMTNHIFVSHKKLYVSLGYSGLRLVTRVDVGVDVAITVDMIIQKIPQYLGLTCETSLDSAIRNMYLNGLFNLDEVTYHSFAELEDRENYDIVVRELCKLDYSCALCDADYDTFPSIEVFASHMRFAHARYVRSNDPADHPSLTG